MPTEPIKEHWILRITPPRYRDRVTRVGLIFGPICRIVWMFGAFSGLFFGPLTFAISKPTAPISQPILWLRRISGADGFLWTYTLTMFVFIGVVYTGHTLLEYLHKSRNA